MLSTVELFGMGSNAFTRAGSPVLFPYDKSTFRNVQRVLDGLPLGQAYGHTWAGAGHARGGTRRGTPNQRSCASEYGAKLSQAGKRSCQEKISGVVVTIVSARVRPRRPGRPEDRVLPFRGSRARASRW